MRIAITRDIKIKLLKWLKSGYVDTLDIPEIQTTGAQEFLALMQSASVGRKISKTLNSDDSTNNTRS